MKNIKNTMALAALFVGIVFSCDSFTEVDLPNSQVTGSAVYEDAVTATAALSDIYARLRDNSIISAESGGATQLLGHYADELEFFGNNTSATHGFYNHAVIPSNTAVANVWNSCYAEIYAANALLEGVENSANITGEVRSRLQGEALFIRAILHFQLMNFYGAVPYIKTTDYRVNTTVSRLPVEQGYENVINDLKAAKEALPETYPTTGRVRANKWVAAALLARVYLYHEEWALAEQEATSVLANATVYTSEPNLNLAFLKDSPSVIWNLHAGQTGTNTAEGRSFIFLSGPPIITALSSQLLGAFESGDQRRVAWVKSVTNGTATWHHANKYKLNNVTAASQEFSIVLRIEEQFLIRAEARSHQGNISGAQQDINKIRSRAGLSDTTAETEDALLKAIMQERQIEFFTEQGHRWFDLKRNGLASSILDPIKPGWKDTDVLLPLPEAELLLNNNLQPQNPGY